MSIQEKLVAEFMALGHVSSRDANAALQVYLELCEVKKYWDVDHHYHDELKLIYFTAKKRRSEKPSIFIPRCDTQDLTYNLMEDFFKLCPNTDDTATVYLVLVSADSTCVYYQMSQGLQQPVDTTAKHLRLNREEKLDIAIRKNRELLHQSALCGIPVTIRGSSCKRPLP